MQPGDSISRNLNIPILTGDAIREAETRSVVSKLHDIFLFNHPEPVGIDSELGRLPEQLNNFTGSILNYSSLFEMSKAYDSFEQDGVKMVSRVVRLGLSGENGYTYSQIFLFSLMGEKQKSITIGNCPFGALTTCNGDLVLFKVEENPNKGNVIPKFKAVDLESENILMVQGPIDDYSSKISIASPEEERYAILPEFQKALDALVVPFEGSNKRQPFIVPILELLDPNESEWEVAQEDGFRPEYEEGQDY